jgi:hypothetical protein
MFNDIYETDENIEVVELFDRINKNNPGKIRQELLYY